MSWMDSWSRPGKSSAIPPPYYLTVGESILYCHTCGRMISPRKTHQRQTTPVKYCSERCRTHKPGGPDKQVDETILALLEGTHENSSDHLGGKSKGRKGDPRRLITCDEIEEALFGSRQNPEKSFGRKKNRYSRAIRISDDQWRSVDMESSDEETIQPTFRQASPDIDDTTPEIGVTRSTNAKVRPPQSEAEMNFSAMGGERSKAEKIEETPENVERRQKGQQEAEEREMVRRAARRAVVFGLEPSQGPKDEVNSKRTAQRARADSKGKPDEQSQQLKRKCEAVMNGQVVEPSFAKGNWAIRWRD